jgi:hypothetical protein
VNEDPRRACCLAVAAAEPSERFATFEFPIELVIGAGAIRELESPAVKRACVDAWGDPSQNRKSDQEDQPCWCGCAFMLAFFG